MYRFLVYSLAKYLRISSSLYAFFTYQYQTTRFVFFFKQIQIRDDVVIPPFLSLVTKSFNVCRRHKTLSRRRHRRLKHIHSFSFFPPSATKSEIIKIRNRKNARNSLKNKRFLLFLYRKAIKKQFVM
jgi:hypothetical protein